MTVHESIQAAAQLRLRMHMNSRLRLETLAALSKVFREHNEPIQDQLLGSLVFAVPHELLGEAPPEEAAPVMRAHGGKPSIPPPRRDSTTPGKPTIPPPRRDSTTPGKPSIPPPVKHH